MKTIFIGDIHGKNIWKSIIIAERPDRVIFMGDYFDSYDISSKVQQENFKDIIEWKSKSSYETILLIGNHDYHYFGGVNEQSTSGFQKKHKWSIQHIIEENKSHMQMAYSFDNILCTHAGISYDFMNLSFGKNNWSVDDIPQLINDLWTYRPGKFKFTGNDPYGDDVYQTPIWIRPRSLKNSNTETSIEDKWIQVVGHTIQESINDDPDQKYYFVDSLDYNQYLVMEDGKFTTKAIFTDLL